MKDLNLITKYLEYNKDGIFGEWIYDSKSKGTLEDPIQMPFVRYNNIVSEFIDDVIYFVDANEELGLRHYGQILEKNNIEWGIKSMESANYRELDDVAICALVVGIVRGDRFCEGALLSFFEKGIIFNWLKELDERNK